MSNNEPARALRIADFSTSMVPVPVFSTRRLAPYDKVLFAYFLSWWGDRRERVTYEQLAAGTAGTVGEVLTSIQHLVSQGLLVEESGTLEPAWPPWFLEEAARIPAHVRNGFEYEDEGVRR